MPLPSRRLMCFEVRILAGMCEEPEDQLGLARVVQETVTKGTKRRSAQDLSDAFDAIGAVRGSGVGRETTSFSCSVLPEHFERAVELHAEFLREPTFPPETVEVAVELSRQEHLALADDPQELLDKHLSRLMLGPVLGRHELGEPQTLDALTPEAVAEHWARIGCAGRMQISAAGPIEPERVRSVFERAFAGWGGAGRVGRVAHSVRFTPGRTHFLKELEQEQMSIAFPGVGITDEKYAVQRVMLGVLSGGMSGRLFTEVREKQGLVYWVGAWQETPRGCGFIVLGASTTPERCDQTYRTLFRELDRLGEDLADEELDRAKATITARVQTRGYTTRSLCAELADDLFYRGRPMSHEEKLARVQAVTTEDIRAFLQAHPRDRLCVVTLGPKALESA